MGRGSHRKKGVPYIITHSSHLFLRNSWAWGTIIINQCTLKQLAARFKSCAIPFSSTDTQWVSKVVLGIISCMVNFIRGPHKRAALQYSLALPGNLACVECVCTDSLAARFPKFYTLAIAELFLVANSREQESSSAWEINQRCTSARSDGRFLDRE